MGCSNSSTAKPTNDAPNAQSTNDTKQVNDTTNTADNNTTTQTRNDGKQSALDPELTFAFIKPDAVLHGNGDAILTRIRQEGFEILAQMRRVVPKELAEEFYIEHKGKPFYPKLVDFMTSSESIALVLRRPNAIKAWRALCGPTNSFVAQKEASFSIRGCYGSDQTKNAVHGSDSLKSSAREIGLMFPNEKFDSNTKPLEHKPWVVFVLGGPGSGKGTQSKNVSDYFGWVHLSAGDLLRAERSRKTDTAELIQKHISEGSIVPVEITLGLIRKAMEDHMAKGKYRFLIDGFPRNLDNYSGWEKQMADFAKVLFVLYFDCSEDTMVQRIMIRSKTENRTDDNETTVRKRMVTFLESTKPIVEKYASENKVCCVSAEPSADTVFDTLKPVFGHITPGYAGPLRVIISGPPASGKGTQCRNIVSKFGLRHISTGDLLREEVAKKSEIGEKAKSFMESGNLVPDDIVIRIVLDKLDDPKTRQEGWLLDGFPRTAKQATALCSFGHVPNSFLELKVPDQVLIDRIQGRVYDPETGNTYRESDKDSLPADVVARLKKRSDDTADKLKTRIEKYKQNRDAVVGQYQDVYHETDGDRDMKVISDDVLKALDNVVAKCQVPAQPKVDLEKIAKLFPSASNCNVTNNDADSKEQNATEQVDNATPVAEAKQDEQVKQDESAEQNTEQTEQKQNEATESNTEANNTPQPAAEDQAVNADNPDSEEEFEF